MKINKNTNLPLDKFIEFALYDKDTGYYMKKNPFGKEGDFITAPNITRLFSEMIAIWVVTFWKSIGSPKKFNLFELGAGNGEMMKVIVETLKNFPECFENCIDQHCTFCLLYFVVNYSEHFLLGEDLLVGKH